MRPEAVIPRRRKRWLTLSLRVAMLLVVILAIWLASVTNRARRQARILEGLRDWGGEVGQDCAFDYQFVDGHASGQQIPNARVPGPLWLRRWIGDEYFREVVQVRLVGNVFPLPTDDPNARLPDGERLK